MGKIIILFLICMFQILRSIHNNLKGIKIKYLFVSFFIISIPLQVHIPLYSLKINSFSGTLGNKIHLYLPVALSLTLLLIKGKQNFNLGIKNQPWIFYFFFLVLISLGNPYNVSKSATFIFVLFFLSHLLLFELMFKFYTKKEIIRGILDGLLILSLAQFILAICYPLLSITSVTNFIHSIGADGATRMNTRPGAIGTFVHPGNLALYLIISSSIFLAAYLSFKGKRIYFLMLIINTITLFLTFSRTSYLVYIIDLSVVLITFKYARKRFFSMANTLKYFIPVTLIILWIVLYSPISEIFLKKDSLEQVSNRLIHFYMAYNAFQTSPIIGVGLNSHIELFTSQLSLSNALTSDKFFTSNPIHNIHLIILIESGLIGLMGWIIFIYRGYSTSKLFISKGKNTFNNLAFVGVLTAIIGYGFTGWAPLSEGILPFVFLIAFCSFKFNHWSKTF